MEQVPLGVLLAALGMLIVLSAFFSSSETGLIGLNRYRLRHDARAGRPAARLAKRLLDQPDRLIGLILLGNNLVNIMAASLSTIIFMRLLGDIGIWVSTAVLTVVILLFAEVAPKTMAAQHPEKIAYPAAFVLSPLLRVMYPLVVVINGLANSLLWLFGVKARGGPMEQLNREELRSVVKENPGGISGDHQQMLLNILDLEHGSIEEVMVPRHEIIGLNLEDDWDRILHQLSQTLYTRLPVYRGDLDNVVGLLHIRTVLTRLSQGRLEFDDIKRSVREPYFVPEGTALTQQLLEFQRLERRMALVVDEYGDIQGLVTLDDILEEIVGEYTTEARDRAKVIRRLEDGAYLVDGGVSLRMLNRRLDWNLPTEGPKTLNGLLLERLEMIPEGKASIRIDNHTMTIAEIGENGIRKVLIKPDRARRSRSSSHQ